jgi:hypothetical protein
MLDIPFPDAVSRVRAALQEQGFGVLTESIPILQIDGSVPARGRAVRRRVLGLHG